MPFSILRLQQWMLVAVVTYSVLWRGGKSLDATWLLVALVASLSILSWLDPANTRKKQEGQTGVPMMLWIAVYGFIFWTILSYLFSSARNYGLDEVFQTIAGCLLFLFAARVSGKEDAAALRRYVASAITHVSLAAIIIGTLVYIFQPVNRFVGTFFDARFHTDFWPNAWAQFLLLATPLILFDANQSDTHRRRRAILVVLSLSLGSLFLSYSRGAILASVLPWIAGGAGALLFFLREQKRMRRIRITLKRCARECFLVLGGAILFFATLNMTRSAVYEVQSVLQKVTFTASEGTSSISERAAFWDHAARMVRERPLLGWGPYSFRFVQPRHMESVLATSDHPHNVLWKYAAERGVPAAILFLFICAWVILVAIAGMGKGQEFSWAALVSVTSVLLHNMIDFNLQFVGIGLLWWLVLGLLVVPSAGSSLGGKHLFREWLMRKFALRADLLLSLLLVLFASLEAVWLVTSSLGRHAEERGEYASAIAWYERSHQELFTRDMYLSEAALHMQAGRLEEAASALDRYEGRNAEDARLWKLRGQLSQMQGNGEEARTFFARAYSLGKYTDPALLRLLVESHSGTTDIKTRKIEFDRLFMEYASAIGANTHFIALSDAPEELKTIAFSLALLFPTDGDRYRSIAQDAASHAQEERARFASRPPGRLW